MGVRRARRRVAESEQGAGRALGRGGRTLDRLPGARRRERDLGPGARSRQPAGGRRDTLAERARGAGAGGPGVCRVVAHGIRRGNRSSPRVGQGRRRGALGALRPAGQPPLAGAPGLRSRNRAGRAGPAAGATETRGHVIESADWHDECGVMGVWGAPQAAEWVYRGLYALQHRGQESAGIVSFHQGRAYEHKGVGLVANVFGGDELNGLPGELAIGHVRYSTTGHNNMGNAQPILVGTRVGPVALAHNGNLVNAQELRATMESRGSIFQTTSDSEIILHGMARAHGATVEDCLAESLALVAGAYSVTVLTPEAVYGVRDPHGFRPLVLGQKGEAWVLASETCALDILQARFVREVEPGELVRLDRGGVTSRPLFPPRPHRCVFELIYFSRPDSEVFGQQVQDVRRRLREKLAEEHPAAADIVISVPDSSNSAAQGYARRLDLPLEYGLIRNHYVGRTFINPSQAVREHGVRVKFNVVRSVLEGRSVAVVDDSIVRGTTSRKLVKLLRRGGAREVHMRVSSPPISWPCFYGIDTPERRELIASSHTLEEIRRYLNVDSLGYLSLDGLQATQADPAGFCYACFTGKYPVPFKDMPSKLKFDNSLPDSMPAVANLTSNPT
ncbi:MAG: amidophosphoribosyltransferase [Candidatus Eisenbacteria bacterium]|nr:amidophosphoribosyltransferase [Candidatus Eisenbacteria bacterium]